MFELDGKVALVTGAGQGVGAGIAAALARQGARVAVNDLVAERAQGVVDTLADLADAPTTAAAFDVTDRSAVTAGVARVAETLGPIDILVNNAGIPAVGFPQVAFKDMDPELWSRFVDLNLYGVLNCTLTCVGDMCDRGWGRVITISSEAGRIGLPIGVSMYGAAKAGAVGLMKHLAVEVAPAGVTVNCLSLGLMDNVDSAWADKIAATVPRRRLGTPADVGAAVAFLSSPEADWITGQVLPVNGGSHTG